jgi:hypothetical protein
MVHLPVSGLEVAVRPPDGSDELIVREMNGSPVAKAIALAARLTDPEDIAGLSVTDFELLLLAIRAETQGQDMVLGLSCPACGARVEISFLISDYVDSPALSHPANVSPDPARPGWYRLGERRFRLPTAADQAAVAGRPDAVKALAGRCLDPARLPAKERARIERAMAAMAPEVSRPVAGQCPECGKTVEAPLHVARLVVAELVRDAAGLHEEVDLIAQAYHWPEAEILALPRTRRRAYAERIRARRQPMN